ncbi:MAG: transcriptional regulator, Crp/Fnr family [Polaromonas sp.]|jgi:CRP/FNR family cyclic AMP-dependent transcriptional regulator|nr:transcriptional regulator, Crp/Fnr family [Polaromonas sp.]
MNVRQATLCNPLLEFLASSPWREGLTDEQFDRVCADAVTRTFVAGATICLRESPSEHWLAVVDGLVKVDTVAADGRATTFAGVPGGAWFGEGAVLKGEPRPYAVVAIRDSTIAFVPRATFLWLVDNSHAFSRWLIDQLNARLAYYVALVEGLRLGDVNTRVAYCLAELFNPQLYPNTQLRIEISQEEIGRLTGMVRQTAYRALHELEKAGLIRVQYGSIEVLDLDGLKKYALGAPT